MGSKGSRSNSVQSERSINLYKLTLNEADDIQDRIQLKEKELAKRIIRIILWKKKMYKG